MRSPASLVLPAVFALAVFLALCAGLGCAPEVPALPDGGPPRADAAASRADAAGPSWPSPGPGAGTDLPGPDGTVLGTPDGAAALSDGAASQGGPAEDAAPGADALAAGADALAPGRDGSADGPAPGADALVAGADALAPERDGSADGLDGGTPAGAPSGRAPRAGDLAIVEILVNPAGVDSNREWLEIENLSGAALDLSGLHVGDALSDAAAPAGVLAAGRRLVLGQSGDVSKNGGAHVDVAFGSKVTCNNEGDSIRLCLGACAQGLLLDEVAWKTLPSGYDGHAMIVVPGAGTRCPAQTPFGDGGSFGTPGDPNPPCP